VKRCVFGVWRKVVNVCSGAKKSQQAGHRVGHCRLMNWSVATTSVLGHKRAFFRKKSVAFNFKRDRVSDKQWMTA
jgi:hypothetical protein